MARVLVKEIKDFKRNYIINGNFDYWQRNTTQTSANIGSDDRWINTHTGSTKTHSKQSFTLGQVDVQGFPLFYSRTVVTSVIGVGNYVSKYQLIESLNLLAGKTITLSLYAKAEANKNITIEFMNRYGTGGTPSVESYFGHTTLALTTAWQKFTVTVNVPSLSGKTLGTNNNDALGVNFWFDAGSNFNARTNSLGQQSGTFDIAQVMVNEGSVAAPFQLAGVDLAGELALCQRYFEKSYSINTNVQSNTSIGVVLGNSSNTGRVSGTVFAVRKRATPIITFYSQIGTIGSFTSIGGGDVPSSVISTEGAHNDRGISVASESVASLTTSASYYYHFTADAEL